MGHDPNLLEILFTFGLDVHARRIMFHGEVGLGADFGESPVETAVKSLLYLDKSPGPIEVWINTPGGDVNEMWALFDVMRTRENTVTTVGFGEIASAGCLLLAAGDKRLVTPNCWFMWHGQSTNEGEVTFGEAQARLSVWRRQTKRWHQEMGRLTKRKSSFWREKTKGELWLSAKQLIQYGVADKILSETVQS